MIVPAKAGKRGPTLRALENGPFTMTMETAILVRTSAVLAMRQLCQSGGQGQKKIFLAA